MKHYDRREHHPNRRVDRASHETREAAFTEVPLDDMLENGEVHSNIYGERVEGYPGQGAAEYDDYDVDWKHPEVDYPPRGLT
jgi:hypothetical protein